jgi:hypothetical protein
MSRVAAGMILAEDIANASGVTLMPSGIRLTPMFINRLAKWGVETLLVDVPRAEASGEAEQKPPGTAGSRVFTGKSVRMPSTPEQEEFVKKVAREVSVWFQNVHEDPLMMQLRVIAIRKLVSLGPDSLLNQLRAGEWRRDAKE